MKDRLRNAAELWKSGRPIEAGRILFEMLPPDGPPAWGSRILKTICKDTHVDCQEINNVIRIADDPQIWGQAHAAFRSVRRNVVLKHEKSGPGSRDHEILYRVALLAENVAKVTYNATNPCDGFDEDSGWWIASNLHSVYELFDPSALPDRAWDLMCGDDGNLEAVF